MEVHQKKNQDALEAPINCITTNENENSINTSKHINVDDKNETSSQKKNNETLAEETDTIDTQDIVADSKSKIELNSDKRDEDTGVAEMPNKEVQEEDVPESFFDDFMSDDFFEGLNVVDAWEGDEVVNQEPSENGLKHRGGNTKELKANQSPDNNNSRNKERYKAKDKNGERRRRGDRYLRSHSRDRERNRAKRSASSKARSGKISDSVSRRDPSKTHRDILRDKDKCEKDKTAKILHEKLKVVETGLVPPGMEMEIDIQGSDKTNKLEEGEIPVEQDEVESQKKSVSISKERKKDKEEPRRDSKHSRTEFIRYSPPYKRRKDISPEYRRELKRLRSRSRSPKRRMSSRDRSRSFERRSERRRRNLRRTRSRSLDLRSSSRERQSKYRSPPRKTSPLVKRTRQLLSELTKVYSSDRISPARSIHGLTQPQMPPQILSNTANMNMPHNFMNVPAPFQPIPNQGYIPLQPVPPPQQAHVELDQQYFIGQQTFEPNNYSMPIQQPAIIQNQPVMHLGPPPAMQHNFQPTWHMEGPYSDPMTFFNTNNQYNPGQNTYQQPIPPPLGYVENQANVQSQQMQMPLQIPERNLESDSSKAKNEEEIFAKLFADNKITLSDYLSVTAKSTDSSNPVDIQNKIKVISYCQEALSEINGTTKPTGKFLLRKSQKDAIKPPSAEGLSPFKKVPAVKFQFTTIPKQFDDKLHLCSSLNRLLARLGKEALFQETQKPSTAPKVDDTPRVTRTSTSSIAIQTESVSTSDFGCQVSIEDISSPSKGILKKQSLAKLTPAQLLAQAETEGSPPPAPRWKLFSETPMNRRGSESYREFDDVDRRNSRKGEISGWSIPSRNVMSAVGHYTRSPDDLHHLYNANRHEKF